MLEGTITISIGMRLVNFTTNIRVLID